MRVALKDIAILKRQRSSMDVQKMNDLKNSILEIEALKGEGNGLIHVVNLRPRREDDVYPVDYVQELWRGKPVVEPWILVTGGRRTEAHRQLGRADIEARNFADLTPLDQRVVELSENVNREDLDWQERLAAEAEIHAIRIQQAQGRGETWSQTDTGKELGVSVATVSRDLALNELIKKDPSIAKASTKAAAMRKIGFKGEIARRVAAIKSVDIGDLRRRIVTADMRTFIRSMADNSVDLHFSDFPFGIDYDKVRPDSETQKGVYRDDPDAVRDLLAEVVLEMVRTLRPGGWAACMMGWSNYQFLAGLFRTACKAHHNYGVPAFREDGSIILGEYNGKRQCRSGPKHAAPCVFLEPEELPWIWHRPNSRQPSLWPELHANNQYELICVVNGGNAKLMRPNVPNVLVYDAVYTDRIHEMQRPHDLCKEIISRLSVAGERVVDLCYGSGAHLAAALDLGRDAVGCDISSDNLGPALQLCAQFYKGPAVQAAIRSPAQTVKQQADEMAAIVEAEISDEEAESVGL